MLTKRLTKVDVPKSSTTSLTYEHLHLSGGSKIGLFAQNNQSRLDSQQDRTLNISLLRSKHPRRQVMSCHLLWITLLYYIHAYYSYHYPIHLLSVISMYIYWTSNRTVKDDHHTGYSNFRVLLFGFTQCNNILLKSSIMTNESSISCLDMIEQKQLCLVKP